MHHDLQGLVMLLLRMNWSYATTINFNSAEDEAALKAFQQQASEAGICISLSQQFSMDSSDEEMDNLINHAATNTSANVVIVFASSSSMKKLIATILRAGDTALALQFILNHRAVLGIPPNVSALRGVLGLRNPLPPADDEFDEYFKLLTPGKVDPVRNPWFADYWQRKLQCNLNGSGT